MLNRNRNKSDDLADRLRAAIQSGDLVPGSRLPSSRELGRQFGISYITANRALNQLVLQQLITRTNRGASFVSRPHFANRKFRIAMIDAEYPMMIWNSIAARVRECIIRELMRHNAEVRLFREQDTSGVYWDAADAVLLGTPISPETEARLRQLEIPVIRFREEHTCDLPFHQLVIDLEPGFHEAFRNVTPDNCDGVIIVSERKLMWPRRDAAEKIAREAGFSPEQITHIYANDQIFELNYPIWQRVAAQARNKFIFCCGDLLASGLLSVLREQQLLPDRDYRLASFDNMEGCGYCPFGEPVISSVGFSRTSLAEQMAELLFSLLESPCGGSCRHMLFIPTFFVKRKWQPSLPEGVSNA